MTKFDNLHITLLENYSNISNILSNMVKVDQKDRNKLAEYYDNPKLAHLSWEQQLALYKKDNNIPQEQEEIFPSQTNKVKKLISNINFETLATKDWENLFLLVQHADDDITLQKQMLPFFYKRYGNSGNSTPYQMLHDRISCAETGTQKFGTQNGCRLNLN